MSYISVLRQLLLWIAMLVTPFLCEGQKAPLAGTLTGVVKDCYSNIPIAGATVTCGPYTTVTNAAGVYTLNGIPAGNYLATASAPTFLSQTLPVAIYDLQTTVLDFNLCPVPAMLTGVVYNAQTGQPVIGAKIEVIATPYGSRITYSVAGGVYNLNLFPVGGPWIPTAQKTGFDDGTGSPVTFTQGVTVTQDFPLAPSKLPPGSVMAALNGTQTAVNINWTKPAGPNQLIYDDGIQDDFTVWAQSGNLNAVKFTPVWYPATVFSGSIDVGVSSNYSGTSNPFVPFQVTLYDDDGAGGMPGTELATVDVLPTGPDFGWISFDFPPGIVVGSGSIYMAMRQGGNAPNALGIAIDNTSPQLRSYSRNVTSGGPWVPSTNNFMMRMVVSGPGVSTPSVYRVYRLRQGEEANPAVWTTIGVVAGYSVTDHSWPTLICGPYRWAVTANYPGPTGGMSVPAFSNVIGKCWAATVDIQSTIECNCGNGALVTLTNVGYPDTTYSIILDTSGYGQIQNVWLGNYDMTISQYGCNTVNFLITIMGNKTVNVVPVSNKPPVRNLQLDNQTLQACWRPPSPAIPVFTEDWNSGSFSANQWTVNGGVNWQQSASIGNPAPSAIFNWTPTCTNCDQYLTSKSIWGQNAPQLSLKYDIFLDSYGTTTLNMMLVEIWDGSQWTVLHTYDNQNGDIPWTSESLDISAYSNTSIKFRFHAQNEDTYDLNYWSIDNIQVIGNQAYQGPPECLVGYNIGLNGVQSGFTVDTCYQIPPGHVVYGHQYNFCVTAVYGENGFVTGGSIPVCDTFTPQFLYPPLNLQGEAIECDAYLIWEKPHDESGNTPPGLTGYKVYKDYAFYHFIGDPDSLEYYDPDLDPGTYLYNITALYDLTPYGFPGQTDESSFASADGVPVEIICGPIIPFIESWEHGSFTFNGWEFEPEQGNWNIQNTKEAGSPPYADFSWDPIRTNYSYAMISQSLDASEWSCANLWLEFDLRLTDRYATGTEKLKVEILYSNTWHEVAEFANSGSFGWTHYEYPVDNAVGHGLKLRFIAYGENSGNILHWSLDNISVIAECKPPVDIYYECSYYYVKLYWSPPDCIGLIQSGDLIYDDGIWEDGLRINPGYTMWLGTLFPLQANLSGIMESVDIYFVDNGTGSPQNFIIELFDKNRVSLGTSAPFNGYSPEIWINVPLPLITFTGPVYAMVKYDNLSGNGYYLGCDTDGPYASQMLAYEFDGSAWINPNNWPSGAVFMVRGHAVLQTDNSDSSVLLGYNVYRTNETGQPPFNKLTPNVITSTTYPDYLPISWPWYCFRYYVTAVHNDLLDQTECESPPTDTVLCCGPVGMNETGNRIFSVYPNPALQVIKISSSLSMEKLEILDLYGSTVLVIKTGGSKEISTDISRLTPGLYYVRAVTAEGTLIRKLIITR